MDDRLGAGIPSRYVTSQLGQLRVSVDKRHRLVADYSAMRKGMRPFSIEILIRMSTIYMLRQQAAALRA